MTQTDTSDIDSAGLQRVGLLESIYDLSQCNVHQTISLQTAGKNAKIEHYSDVIKAAAYLDGKGLFDFDGGGWTGRITVVGIDMVEGWRKPRNKPEKKADNMQPVQNVINNYGSIHGSNLVQGASNPIFVSQDQTAELKKFVDQIAEQIPAAAQMARLSQTDQQSLNSSVGSLKYEAKENRPKKAVLKAHLDTILEIFKMASTAPVAWAGISDIADNIRHLIGL